VHNKTNVITTKWTMKKKANGMFRARPNARGYVQIDCKHYNSDIIYSPVTNEATIHIVFCCQCYLDGQTNRVKD